MTLPSPRAKSSHFLAMLLSALLACPAPLPSLPARDSADSPAPSRQIGPRHKPHWQRSPARPGHPLGLWCVDADDLEASGLLDGLRQPTWALSHQPGDHPSLVPVPMQRVAPCQVIKSCRHSHPHRLRC